MGDLQELIERHRAELKWLARQYQLVWGGVYERGGDADLWALERAGLIEGVAKPYAVGRLTFRGGYRITDAGLRALEAQEDGG